VGRPGLEPGTTGLKVHALQHLNHCESTLYSVIKTAPSPILARLERTKWGPPSEFLPKVRAPNSTL